MTGSGGRDSLRPPDRVGSVHLSTRHPGCPLNLSDLDLRALSHALDDSDPDRESYLDRETGSLWTFVFSEASDETRARRTEILEDAERWMRIPSRSPQATFEEIEDFVEELPEGDVQEALFVALEKRGAMKNFREALMEHPEVRQAWLGASRRRSQARLDEFLGTLGLAPEESAS